MNYAGKSLIIVLIIEWPLTFVCWLKLHFQELIYVVDQNL